MQGRKREDRKMPVKKFANECRECKVKSRYGKRIKELEQTIDMQDREVNTVLNKIRDEIDNMSNLFPFTDHIDPYVKVKEVFNIIDKYTRGRMNDTCKED